MDNSSNTDYELIKFHEEPYLISNVRKLQFELSLLKVYRKPPRWTALHISRTKRYKL